MKELNKLSLERLIKRIIIAPDFKYDDEVSELNKRLKLRGLVWFWNKSDEIVIKEG